MKRIALLILALVSQICIAVYLPFIVPSMAGVTCSLPFTLTNGSLADATQVMANYNALVVCLTNAAAAGANNDITSLSALTTPLTPGQGGSNVYLGASPTASGNQIIIGATTPTGYVNTQNYTIIFVSPTTNVATEAMIVNGQPLANIYKQSTAGPIPLTGGEIQTNQVVMATYDGTEFQINPVPSVAAGWGLSQNASATQLQIATSNPAYPAGACINLQLNASVATNTLTVAVKGNNGTDPSAANPVLCQFRNTTLGSGNPVWVSQTSALSINTNAAGASLGTQNSVPFRLWVLAFNNSGTLQLALWQSGAGSSPPSINPLNTSTLQSTTAISAAATSAGVFYTSNGVTLSNKTFTILGYVEYSSGLATAGSYGTPPNIVQVYSSNIPLPGQVVQSVVPACSTVIATANSTSKVQATPAAIISPVSPANLVGVRAYGMLSSTGANTVVGEAQLSRGTSFTGIGKLAAVQGLDSTAVWSIEVPLFALDQPGTTLPPITYVPFIWANSSNPIEWNGNSGLSFNGTPNACIEVTEIQG